MKRINLILSALVVLGGLFTIQSCSKDNTTFTVYNSFTAPTVSAPVNGSTIKITGTTVDLKWTSTNADSDTPSADVYFGTDPKPPLYKAGNAGLTLTVPVVLGKTYYWHVTMKDSHGVLTYGTTWSFTVYEPIGAFVGTYKVDEPAEGWSYIITTLKGGANLLTVGTGKASVTAGASDGWWASWITTFNMDFTANTYSMPLTDFGGGYKGIESGTINPATGQMIGNYTVYQNGAAIETGKHTYTKQ